MTRRKLDFYPSGRDVMGALQVRIPIVELAEPCVGTGDLIAGRHDVVWTNDVDENREATYHLNAAAPASWHVFPRVPWVVTNPPFNKAAMVLALALQHAERGVAFLLRLSFLEPVKARADFLKRHRPDWLVVLPRYSFTGDGRTDSVTCGWMVWARGKYGRGVDVVTKDEMKVRARERQLLLPGTVEVPFEDLG